MKKSMFFFVFLISFSLQSLSQQKIVAPPPADSIITEMRAAQEAKLIYPNPANDILNIIGKSGDTVKLVDLKGSTIMLFLIKEEKTILNLKNLDANVYFIKVGNTVIKFIKN